MIGIKANKANATLIESEKLTSGRVGLPIYFEFSTEWDGLGVTAVFKAGNVSIKKVLTVTNHRAETEVPWEVLVTPRVNLVVGLKGVKTNSQTGVTETVIPTIYCGCGDTIEFGTDDNGASNTAPVTATDKQQMMSAMETAVSNIIVAADVTVGSHSASEGNPSGTATLSATGGGKKLTLALDYIKGLKGDKGDPTESIDDSKTDTSHTWSSSKLNTALNKKADIAEIAYVDEKFKWFHELMNGQEFDTTRREETAYSITAPNGAKAVEIEKICGKSQVMQQLVGSMGSVENFEGASTTYNSSTNEISITNISRTAKYNTGSTRGVVGTVVPNHKYLYLYTPSYAGLKLLQWRASGSFVALDNFFTATPETLNNENYIYFRLTNEWDFIDLNPVGTTIKVKLNLFDLTAMFGSGNEPTTVAQFKSIFPKDYYPYGNSLLDAKVRRIEVKGKNLLPTDSLPSTTTSSGITYTNNGDGSFKVSGTYSAYTQIVAANTFTLPSGTYTLSIADRAIGIQLRSSAGTTTYANTQDGNGKATFTLTESTELKARVIFNAVFTEKTYYPQIELGTTATAYSAYHEPVTEPIPTALQTYLADKCYGAGIAVSLPAISGQRYECNFNHHNDLDIENKKYVQNIGEYTFTGNETWTHSGSSYYCSATLTEASVDTTTGHTVNPILSPILGTTSANSLYYGSVSSGIGIWTNRNMYIGESDYANVSRLTGTKVYYLKATPVEYDISEYIHSFDPMMTVEAGGTITYKQVNDDVHIPVKNTVEYAIKLSEVTT